MRKSKSQVQEKTLPQEQVESNGRYPNTLPRPLHIYACIHTPTQDLFLKLQGYIQDKPGLHEKGKKIKREGLLREDEVQKAIGLVRY